MSFKLFIANVFGQIKPAKKIEEEQAKVLNKYLNYCDFEKSDELKEYLALESLINSQNFKQKKLEIQNLKYKGSKEEKLFNEFTKLDSDSGIKMFKQTIKSEELKRFLILKDSDLVANYNKCKSEVKSLSIFSPKSDAFKQEEQRVKSEFEKFKSSGDWTFYLNFSKSADYKNYLKFLNSQERKRFDDLNQKTKNTSESDKEDKNLAELAKLKKNKKLLRFYETNGSAELTRFKKLEESGIVLKYDEFKKEAKSYSFFAPKSEKLKKIEQGIRDEFNKIDNSADWKFYKQFSSSAEYKNYLKLNNSETIKRYEELLLICNSDEFKNKVVYLKDADKWKKTEEYIKEIRFEELKKLPQLINYLKYKGSSVFDFHRNWELYFEDRFTGDKLDSQKWMTKSHWANRMVGHNFSQAGDIHAFTDGENVLVKNNSLKIQLRKEKTKGMQWLLPIGFVEKEFDYSSGIIAADDNYWWKHGILEAKVRYAPSRNIVDLIYLIGEESSPQINLFECGVKNRVGMLRKSGDSIEDQTVSISGLKKGEFYIFRLEWSEGLLKWSVNNKDLFSLTSNIPQNEMHVNISSIIVTEKSDNLPHNMEVEWIKIYQKVKK